MVNILLYVVEQVWNFIDKISGQEIVKPPEPMIRIGSVSVKGSYKTH